MQTGCMFQFMPAPEYLHASLCRPGILLLHLQRRALVILLCWDTKSRLSATPINHHAFVTAVKSLWFCGTEDCAQLRSSSSGRCVQQVTRSKLGTSPVSHPPYPWLMCARLHALAGSTVALGDQFPPPSGLQRRSIEHFPALGRAQEQQLLWAAPTDRRRSNDGGRFSTDSERRTSGDLQRSAVDRGDAYKRGRCELAVFRDGHQLERQGMKLTMPLGSHGSSTRQSSARCSELVLSCQCILQARL